MTYFNRFDIAEAHYLYARHYHIGGDTRREDFRRLNRIGFAPGLSLRQSDDPKVALTDNGGAIYAELVSRRME